MTIARARASYPYRLVLLLALAGSLLVACSSASSGAARFFGWADDVMRPFMDDFARVAGAQAADDAVMNIGRRFEAGLVTVAGAADSIPAELRSGMTGVVCKVLVYAANTATWPDEATLGKFVGEEVAGGLSAQYGQRELGQAGVTIASNLWESEEVDQQALTDVVCAAAGYSVSR